MRGHDSIEDAHAALMLAILKANMGPFFPYSDSPLQQNIRISLCDHLKEKLAQGNLLDTLQSKFILHLPPDLMTKAADNYTPAVAAGCSSPVTTCGTIKSAIQECREFVSYQSNSSCPKLLCFIGSELQSPDILINFKDYLLELVKSEPSLVVIVTAQSSARKVKEMSSRRRVVRKAGVMSASTWTDSLESELKSEQRKLNVGRCVVLGGQLAVAELAVQVS